MQHNRNQSHPPTVWSLFVFKIRRYSSQHLKEPRCFYGDMYKSVYLIYFYPRVCFSTRLRGSCFCIILKIKMLWVVRGKPCCCLICFLISPQFRQRSRLLRFTHFSRSWVIISNSPNKVKLIISTNYIPLGAACPNTLLKNVLINLTQKCWRQWM